MPRRFVPRVKSALPANARSIVRRVYRGLRPNYYPYESWSQGGEDMVLRQVFTHVPDGFYVDVGAYHPKFGSNTYALYQKGWRGINIDARPGSMNDFRRARRRDVNLELGIADEAGDLTLHVFVDDELSTFDSLLAAKRATSHKLDRVVPVSMRRLDDVLAEHRPKLPIHLLSVDCEGFDLQVLRSNDWNLYRPWVVLVEALEARLENFSQHPTAEFLHSRAYRLIAATPMNLFFRDSTR